MLISRCVVFILGLELIMAEKIITEKEVRAIARDEIAIAFTDSVNGLQNQISENTQILGRLERLLLGEEGTEESDTLKARANFAYGYAKHNSELKLWEKTTPIITWFNDMNTPDKGCDESKLDILGKIIAAWTSAKLILGLFGIVNVATFIAVIILLRDFLS